MTTWDDYLASIGELDTVRRNSATAVATQENAATAARAELNGLRERIGLQRARIVDVASRARRPVPITDPTPVDRMAATSLVPPGVMDPTPGVSAALKAAWAALDAADGSLTAVAEAPSSGGALPTWRPLARNAVPYAWYALLATIALVFINGFAGGSSSAQFVALAFDLVIPLGAFVLGVASIALLFAADRTGRKPKSLALGLAICVIPLVIGIALTVF